MEMAFGYLRVSGKGQVDGDGFPRQQKAIDQHATGNAIKVVRVFRDEGVSGTIENMDRPAWRQLIAALHSSGVKTILIERLDRLARDLMVQEAAIADLRRNGFTLISAAEPDLMASDPSRVLMRQLMGAVAQYDKSQLVAKLNGARARKRQKDGRCEGRKPFGHFPLERSALARMSALRSSGLAFERIAATLNAESVPTRSGGNWHGVVVNRILSRRPPTLGT